MIRRSNPHRKFWNWMAWRGYIQKASGWIFICWLEPSLKHWVSHCVGYLAAVCIQSFVEITNPPDTPQLQTPHAAWAQRASFTDAFRAYSLPLEHTKLDGCALTSKKYAAQQCATMLCNTTHWDPDCVLGDVKQISAVIALNFHGVCVFLLNHAHSMNAITADLCHFLEVDSFKKLKADNMWIKSW